MWQALQLKECRENMTYVMFIFGLAFKKFMKSYFRNVYVYINIVRLFVISLSL